MRPYYESDNITLYCGNCLHVLSHIEPASAIITDPPYGVRRPNAYRVNGPLKEVQGNDSVDPAWIFAAQVTDPAAIYSFCTWDSLEEWKTLLNYRFKVRSCIVWDKEIHGCGDTKTCWAPRHELILYAANGRYEFVDRPVDVLRHRRTSSDLHPYEKPVPLLQTLLATTTGMVLDPFAGCGSTLIAAKLQRRPAIGIEISEEYCEIAANRLKQSVFDFESEPSKR